jgi:hypothetical protein
LRIISERNMVVKKRLPAREAFVSGANGSLTAMTTHDATMQTKMN